ncbi:MAG: hypothetical protein HY903_13690 [Deltaproteobacteria bacterium]|nr:hypothetical protein [Deltaproteobacteria bacterium]
MMADALKSVRLTRDLVTDVVLTALNLVGVMVVAALAFAEPTGTSAAAATVGKPIGRVTERLREVRRRQESALYWNDVARLEPVYQGDVVYVGPDSAAVVSLDDGSQIDIDQSSLVVIGLDAADAGGGVGPVEVKIVRGAAVGKAGSGRLSLEASGVATRLGAGSAADVRVREGKGLSVAVRRGKATMATAGGALNVAAGEGRKLNDDGTAAAADTAPRIRLLSPGADARLVVPAGEAKVELVWEAEAGVGPYTVEVAKDADFVGVVARRRSPSPGVSVPDLGDGVYYWRVERRGKKKEALQSEVRRLVISRELAPVIYRPRADTLVDLSERAVLSLAWSEVEGAAGYVVEIARGASFQTPLYSVKTRTTALLLNGDEQRLEEGRHCARARVDDPSRVRVLWSPVVCFRLVTRPVLRAPELFEPGHEDKAPGKGRGASGEQGWLYWVIGSVAYAAAPAAPPVVLRWEKLPGAVSYLVEVAADADFKSVVAKEVTPNTYYRFVPPGTRRYLWRVRGVDAEGREGRVSVAKSIGLELPGPSPRELAGGGRVEVGGAVGAVRLQWEPVAGAERYEIEVADNAEMTGADRETAAGATHELKPRRVGTFYWRVVAVLSGGERTLPGRVATFTVVATPPAPVQPKRGEELRLAAAGGVEVRLQWTKRPVDRYEVEVARDQSFKRRGKTTTATTNSATVKLEDSGRWYWHVRVVEPVATAYGPIGSFVLIPDVAPLVAPAPDETLVVTTFPTTVALEWSPVVGAASYNVGVAPEGKEAEVVRQQVKTPRATVVLPREGPYLWSVQSVGADGAVSAASPEQRFELRTELGDDGSGSGAAPPGNGSRTSLFATAPFAGHLSVGPALGAQYDLGDVIAPRLGLEVRYVRTLSRFDAGVALAVSYLTASREVVDAPTRAVVRSRIHVLPAEVRALASWPTPVVAVTAGAGLSVTTTYGTVRTTGQERSAATTADVGGSVRLGAARDVGIGAAVADLGFGFGTHTTGIVETAPLGLFFAVGYQLCLW